MDLIESEKAFNHNSGRNGQIFWMLSVPLHLQLHPCIPPSSGKLMGAPRTQVAGNRPRGLVP